MKTQIDSSKIPWSVAIKLYLQLVFKTCQITALICLIAYGLAYVITMAMGGHFALSTLPGPVLGLVFILIAFIHIYPVNIYVVKRMLEGKMKGFRVMVYEKKED